MQRERTNRGQRRNIRWLQTNRASAAIDARRAAPDYWLHRRNKSYGGGQYGCGWPGGGRGG